MSIDACKHLVVQMFLFQLCSCVLKAVAEKILLNQRDNKPLKEPLKILIMYNRVFLPAFRPTDVILFEYTYVISATETFLD